MQLSATQLFEIYDATKQLVNDTDEKIIHSKFQSVMDVFEDKRNDFNLKIMVYGVYNSGKSTLINSLLGENKAATADIPLTAKIEKYRWNNYVIYDTPGVDAPKDHETVTLEHLKKVDGIIFVVNPSGAAEEEKTLKILVDLLVDKKKVFLVFNEKQPLSEEDFVCLKNAIRERIQVIAEKKELQDILEDIPIFKINAARALKGRIESHDGLINKSGFPELINGLNGFLESFTDHDVCQRLSKVLSGFIQEVVTILNQKSQSTIIDGYNELLVSISTESQESRSRLKKLIERDKLSIYPRIKQTLLKDPQNSETEINQIFEKSLMSLNHEFQQEAQHLEILLQGKIDTLQKIMVENQFNQSIDINIQPEEEVLLTSDKGPSLVSSDNINHAFQAVQKFTKPEHIVQGLAVIKDWMPSLMKGIGPKTMEKWAGAAVGKWIPYVGTAVTVLTSVWTMFSKDSEEERLQQQIEEQKKAKERYMAQINDYALDISYSFESAANEMIFPSYNQWINELIQKIKDTLGEMTVQDKNNQDVLLAFEELNIKLND